MSTDPSTWTAVRITFAVAAASTAALLVLATPLAWWLARTRCRCRPWVEALLTLPLVLPPTVIGFYLLVALGPDGPIGGPWEAVGGPRLVFSFAGVVIGSIVFSLPFVLLPLVNAFRAIGERPLEVAATLGATRLDRFFSVALPIARPAFTTAAVMGFAHTVGEFGVVLMIGGNVPGETQVLSIALYEHVELLRYDEAHAIAGGLIAFSLLVLVFVQSRARVVPTGGA
ncbi:MAG: molybdate ABC transporter permease subunit [Planctomycetota bacterium JB042]